MSFAATKMLYDRVGKLWGQITNTGDADPRQRLDPTPQKPPMQSLQDFPAGDGSIDDAPLLPN